jgi:MFS superfamily sulfate permease-like transporter
MTGMVIVIFSVGIGIVVGFCSSQLYLIAAYLKRIADALEARREPL